MEKYATGAETFYTNKISKSNNEDYQNVRKNLYSLNKS